MSTTRSLHKDIIAGVQKLTSADGEICPICTDKINYKNVFVILYCGHLLCSACALKAMKTAEDGPESTKNCPTCRHDNVLKNADMWLCQLDLVDWKLTRRVVRVSRFIEKGVAMLAEKNEVGETDIEELCVQLKSVPEPFKRSASVDKRMRLKMAILKKTSKMLRGEVKQMIRKQTEAIDKHKEREKQVAILLKSMEDSKSDVDIFTEHTSVLMNRLDVVNKEIDEMPAAVKEMFAEDNNIEDDEPKKISKEDSDSDSDSDSDDD